jgi:hypothetical protein
MLDVCRPPTALPRSWTQYRFHVDEDDFEVVVSVALEGEPGDPGSADLYLKSEQPAGPTRCMQRRTGTEGGDALAGHSGAWRHMQACQMYLRLKPAVARCALPLVLQAGDPASMTCARAGTPPLVTAPWRWCCGRACRSGAQASGLRAWCVQSLVTAAAVAADKCSSATSTGVT